MRRSALLIAGYVGATVLVTGAAVAGVRLVTDQVVEPLPPISAELTSGSESDSPSEADPTSSDDPSGALPSDDTSTEPDDGHSTAEPTDTPTSSPTATSTPTSSPSPTGSPSPTDDDSESEDHSESPSPTSSPTSQQSELRSYQVIGGNVTLRFSPGRVEVVSVSPNPGFVVDIEDEGYELRVDFESDSHRSRVKGWWEDGPRDEVREEPR